MTKATWTVTGDVGSLHKLCFTAGARHRARPAERQRDREAGRRRSRRRGTAPEPVTVVDGTESSNNDPSTSAALSTSRLYLSYLTSAADVDYYRVPVPVAGTRVTFHLSHLPADYDLVV